MFTVVVSEKGGQPTRHEFNTSEITIGRMKGNDIVLPKGNVSKQHSRIFFKNPGFSVIDLKSTNGTYVNGRKVTAEQPITDSDKIYIGDFILQVDINAGAGAGTPAPGAGFGTAPPAPDAGAPAFTPSKHPELKPPEQFRTNLDQQGGDDLRMTMEDSMHHATNPDLVSSSLNQAAPAPQTPVSTPTPQTPAPAAPMPQPSTNASPQVPVPAPSAKSSSAQSVSIWIDQELGNESNTTLQNDQQMVASALLQTIAVDELPLIYPLDPAQLEHYEQLVQSALATVSVGSDPQVLTQILTTECGGLGALEQYLNDPNVQDIYVNRYDHIVLRKHGNMVVAPVSFSHPEFAQLAAWRLIGTNEPDSLVQNTRLSDGTFVTAVFAPIAADSTVITIRKALSEHPTLDQLTESKMLSANMATFLKLSVEAGRSILVAGPSGSGKTTLLSALAQLIPAARRVVAIEEVSNLPLPHPTAIKMQANATNSVLSMQDIVKNAMLMQPQTLLLDSCRGPEAYDWVTAAASSTVGSMATVHATGVMDALTRLESLSLMGSKDVSPRGLRDQIARAANLVVSVNRTASGDFYVQQISEIHGVDLDAFRLSDIFYHRTNSDGGSAFHSTGYIPYFCEDLRNYGKDIDLTIFRD